MWRKEGGGREGDVWCFFGGGDVFFSLLDRAFVLVPHPCKRERDDRCGLWFGVHVLRP
jgi:hypothetical protein